MHLLNLLHSRLQRVELIIFENEVEGITIFSLWGKYLWFFVSDSIQGESSSFSLKLLRDIVRKQSIKSND